MRIVEEIGVRELAVYPDLEERLKKLGFGINILRLYGLGEFISQAKDVAHKGKITQDMSLPEEAGGEGKYEIALSSSEATDYINGIEKFVLHRKDYRDFAEAIGEEMEKLLCFPTSLERYKKIGPMDKN
jgi:hypothetical protein